MFYRIDNGKLIDCADYKYANDCLETNITTREYYHQNEDKFAIDENNELVNISDTQEYMTRILEKEKAKQIIYLQSQVDELDQKRIRAVCEPSVKDESTEQTWLEYYNLQIQELRNQIAELE